MNDRRLVWQSTLLLLFLAPWGQAQSTIVLPKEIVGRSSSELLQLGDFRRLPYAAQISILRQLSPSSYPDQVSAAQHIFKNNAGVRWYVWGLDENVASKSFWHSGQLIKALVLGENLGQLILAVGVESEKKSLVASVVVQNLGKTPLDVLPERIEAYELAPSVKKLASVPAAKVAAKAGRLGGFESFALGLASTGATTTVTSSNGETLTVPDYQARARAEKTYRTKLAEKQQASNDILEAALKAQTLFEGKSIVGKVFFDQPGKAGKDIVLRVPLRDVVYEFPFALSK